MTTRLYKVTDGDKAHLVQANSKAQAVRHVAGRRYETAIAKAMDVAQLMSQGVAIEVASEDSDAE